jgi:4-aminobutyrate aminotransferase
MREGSEQDLLARDRQILAEAMKIRFFPIVLRSSRGSIVRDLEGRKYLDFSASWAVASTGYGHPRVVRAVSQAVRRTSTNSPISIPCPATIELAERLARLMPGDFPKKVWFGHSGSEAGDLIAKFLPIAKKRPKILTFVGGYHGQTLGAASLSGHTAQAAFGHASNVTKVPYPNPHRFPGDAQACVEEHVGRIRELLERSGEEYAGLLVEPIQSDGGVIVPPEGFLSRLAALCREYDLYFVVDEVKTGFGRTGRMFAFEHEGVVPDAVMLGKPMASGIPLSAVVGRREILDAVPSGHMMTTAGNPVACTAGLATLDIIEDEGLAERADRLGRQLKARLLELAARFPSVGEVRGRGLMMGLELVRPESGDPDSGLARAVCYRAKQLGLIVFYVGTSSNVLELTPPLVVTEKQLATGVRILAQALEDALAGRVSGQDLEAYSGW